MANISDFATLYDCTIWPYVGRDVYGNPEFGAPVFISGCVWYTSTPQKFTDSKGSELVSKYKILPKFQYQSNFVEGYYIALGADYSAEPNPIIVGAHEIMSAKLIKVPFAGLDDEMVVLV